MLRSCCARERQWEAIGGNQFRCVVQARLEREKDVLVAERETLLSNPNREADRSLSNDAKLNYARRNLENVATGGQPAEEVTRTVIWILFPLKCGSMLVLLGERLQSDRDPRDLNFIQLKRRRRQQKPELIWLPRSPINWTSKSGLAIRVLLGSAQLPHALSKQGRSVNLKIHQV